MLTTEMGNITEQYETVTHQNLDLQRANSRLMSNYDLFKSRDSLSFNNHSNPQSLNNTF